VAFSLFKMGTPAPFVFLVILAFAFFSVDAQTNSFKCPSRNGFFPDLQQCDMYYECRSGVAKQKLCADGMAFIVASPLYARCDVINNVDCASRPYLQQAKETKDCPRANGYYAHEDSKICDIFYQCNNGKVSKLKCQDGLAFDPELSACQWAAKVPGCEHFADKLPQAPQGPALDQEEDDDDDAPLPQQKPQQKPAQRTQQNVQSVRTQTPLPVQQVQRPQPQQFRPQQVPVQRPFSPQQFAQQQPQQQQQQQQQQQSVQQGSQQPTQG